MWRKYVLTLIAVNSQLRSVRLVLLIYNILVIYCVFLSSDINVFCANLYLSVTIIYNDKAVEYLTPPPTVQSEFTYP